MIADELLITFKNLSVDLGEIISNGSHLEDLLQEIAQHFLGLAHITIVAVPYIA
jgi:hypothetical protein